MGGGRTSREVQYIFRSCHPLSVKMDLSKERPWESFEQTPLKQRLRKYFKFQKALDRQRLATQFWKNNFYQKSHRTQRKEGHVRKTQKQQGRKRNIAFRDTIPLNYKRSFNKKKRNLIQNQPLLFQIFKEPPIIFLRKENYGKGHACFSQNIKV